MRLTVAEARRLLPEITLAAIAEPTHLGGLGGRSVRRALTNADVPHRRAQMFTRQWLDTVRAQTGDKKPTVENLRRVGDLAIVAAIAECRAVIETVDVEEAA